MQSKSDTKELITRRRRQILVHSAIYYRLNNSVISDIKFDRWCNELVELQEEHPEIASECPYNVSFCDFEGQTGYDLRELGDHEIMATARALLDNPNLKEDKPKLF